MELDRDNRRLERGPDWGTQLAARMIAIESKIPRQQEAERVRYDIV